MDLKKTIRLVLEEAIKAPSGDNIQPWKMVLQNNLLTVAFDPERVQGLLDWRRIPTLLSLGCLVESIRICASGKGLGVDIRFEETPEFRVLVHFSPSSLPSDPLYHKFPHRLVDRRVYRGGSLSDPLFQAVLDEMKAFQAFGLDFSGPKTEGLIPFLKKAEGLLFSHERPHRELYKWIRFSPAERDRTRDGFYWKNLGVNFIQSRVLKLFKNYRLQKFFNPLFLTFFLSLSGRNMKSSAGFGCIKGRNLAPETAMTSGRLFLRIWTVLNGGGYALQPYTISIVHALWSKTNDFPEEIKPAFRGLAREGEKIIKEGFHLKEDEYPLMLFRTGLAPKTPLPSDARTLRRPLEDILMVKES